MWSSSVCLGHAKRMRLQSSHGRALLLRATASLLVLPPQASFADLTEEVRKAASVVPGYGPSDLLFPPMFRGRWAVLRTVVDVSYPLGKERAPAAEVALAERQATRPQSFEMRFVETSDAAFGASVIPDRAFNVEQREAALGGVPLDELEARWSASNPNVVTLRNRRNGDVTEFKATKVT